MQVSMMQVSGANMCHQDIKVETTCLTCDKTLQDGTPCTEHAEKGRGYECLFCDSNFSRQATLVWHLKSIHNYILSTKPKGSSSGNEHNYYEKPLCSKCNIELENAYELEKHILEHPTQEKKPVTVRVKKPIAPVLPPGITHCNICNKNFPSEEEYRQHLSQYVTKSRPFICCICQTTFSRKRSLVFHLYIHKRSSDPHNKVASLSDIADPPRAYPYVTFPNTASVKTPEVVEEEKPPKKAKTPKKAVPKEKPVSKKKPVRKSKTQIIDIRNNTVINQRCSICLEKFKKVLDLETHMTTSHHAAPVHKCSLCPQSFVLKASLLNHAVSHIF